MEAASARLEALEECRALWLEAPFAAGALDAYATLGRRLRSVRYGTPGDALSGFDELCSRTMKILLALQSDFRRWGCFTPGGTEGSLQLHESMEMRASPGVPARRPRRASQNSLHVPLIVRPERLGFRIQVPSTPPAPEPVTVNVTAP